MVFENELHQSLQYQFNIITIDLVFSGLDITGGGGSSTSSGVHGGLGGSGLMGYKTR